jgi:hypothetical protein
MHKLRFTGTTRVLFSILTNRPDEGNESGSPQVVHITITNQKIYSVQYNAKYVIIHGRSSSK